jgi:uncharacterized membrane protein YccC
VTTGAPDELLGHVERLRRRARADRRATSAPLLVFGVLSLAYPSVSDGLFWMAAGPLGFLVLAVIYRHRAVATGVGSGRGVTAVVTGVLLLTFCLSPLALAPTAATALGLLVLAAVQGNRVLLGWAAAFAVVMGLAGSGLFNGSSARYGVAEALLAAALGAGMTVTGAHLLRRERATV